MLSNVHKGYRICINIVLIIVALITILPLLLLFLSSISSERSLLVNGYSFFPKEISFEAYAYILKNKATIFTAYRNTIVVTIIGTLAHLMLATLMAYPLSLKELPGRKIFSFFVFFTMLFSGGLVPSYLMWTGIFKIKNTLAALIIPNLLLSAVDVMLIRTYFSTSIPAAIYEAAMIDGANYFTIFRKIVLPLGKPIIVTVTVFAGLNYWNDWTNGLYYISKHELYSIQTLLNKMIQDIQALQMNAVASSSASMSIPQVSIRMAIAFVALAPILIIFPFLQKYFESGIALGAVKG